jgi:hypothetical protein
MRFSPDSKKRPAECRLDFGTGNLKNGHPPPAGTMTDLRAQEFATASDMRAAGMDQSITISGRFRQRRMQALSA